MITVTDTWWAAIMRGAAALALAVIIAVHAHNTTAPILFGTYVLVDGVVAAGSVIAAGLGKCGALLLVEGLTGITLGMASIFEPHASLSTLPLYMIIWALVVGSAEIFNGEQAGHGMPNLRERRLPDRRLLRHTLTTSSTSGALALAFAITLAVVPNFTTALAIPLLGLFAASFGYLHLCVGLILGLRAIEQSSTKGYPDSNPGLLAPGSFAFQPPNGSVNLDHPSHSRQCSGTAL